MHTNCDGLITDTIGKLDSAVIFVPNAFTPNADGLNDVFGPVTDNISSFVLTIFDKKNNIIFLSDSLNTNWIPLATANSTQKFYWRPSFQGGYFYNHCINKYSSIGLELLF